MFVSLKQDLWNTCKHLRLKHTKLNFWKPGWHSWLSGSESSSVSSPCCSDLHRISGAQSELPLGSWSPFLIGSFYGSQADTADKAEVIHLRKFQSSPFAFQTMPRVYLYDSINVRNGHLSLQNGTTLFCCKPHYQLPKVNWFGVEAIMINKS